MVSTAAAGLPVMRWPKTSRRAVSTTIAYAVRGASCPSSTQVLLTAVESRTTTGTAGMIVTNRSNCAPATGLENETVIGPRGHHSPGAQPAPVSKSAPYERKPQRLGTTVAIAESSSGSTNSPAQPCGIGVRGTNAITRLSESSARARL